VAARIERRRHAALNPTDTFRLLVAHRGMAASTPIYIGSNTWPPRSSKLRPYINPQLL
jgi:hypothetical protein